MATKTVKKAAPARKKAVAKKAVAKKAVAKKAAPARKKAVAKKAAPARKKAVAKKAAPARKKTVAKKATPVRKKAVAKKATPSDVKKIEFKPSVSVSSADKPWLQREQELPVFLKDVKPEIKKEPISTQGYSKKKSRTPVFVGIISVLLLLTVVIFSASTQSDTNTKAVTQETNETTSDTTGEEVTKTPTDEVVINTDTTKEEDVATPEPSKSSSVDKSTKPTLSSYAPRSFASTVAEQEISFTWRAPSDASSVIGYELSVKKSGTSDWVVISSVTPQQMVISVDLVSLDSTSQYRVGSILENGKVSFSKVILTHPGSVD
jgi:hypothetical protein